MPEGRQKNPTSLRKRLLTAALSGGLAGGIEISTTYPIEFTKVQLQLQQGQSVYQGNLDVLRKTINSKGVVGLYQGLQPALLFTVPKVTVRFAAYEAFRSLLFPESPVLSTYQSLICGTIAGAFEATFVTCPQEAIKVKYIHDSRSSNPKYKGLFSGMAKIYRDLGFRGVYSGYWPTVLKSSSSQMIRFGVLSHLKNRYLEKYPEKCPGGVVPLHLVGLFGGLAGAISVFCNTPVDVIKTKMQGLDAKRYRGNLDCAAKTFREDGFRGFYKGTTARLSRVVFEVGLTFMLVDYVKKPIGHSVDTVWRKAGWDS